MVKQVAVCDGFTALLYRGLKPTANTVSLTGFSKHIFFFNAPFSDFISAFS